MPEISEINFVRNFILHFIFSIVSLLQTHTQGAAAPLRGRARAQAALPLRAGQRQMRRGAAAGGRRRTARAHAALPRGHVRPSRGLQAVQDGVRGSRRDAAAARDGGARPDRADGREAPARGPARGACFWWGARAWGGFRGGGDS